MLIDLLVLAITMFENINVQAQISDLIQNQ